MMRISLFEIVAFVILTIGFSFLFSGTLFRKKGNNAGEEDKKKKGPKRDPLDDLSFEGLVDMLSLCLIDPTDTNPSTSACNVLKALHRRLDKKKELLADVPTDLKQKVVTMLVSFLEAANVQPDVLTDTIVAVGLYVIDDPALQTFFSDAGGIKALHACMRDKSTARYRDVAKWYFWAFSNACFEHPPNKCDFVQCGGLRTALDVLDRDQPRSIMVTKQGLSLLAYVLRDDPQAKFHLGDARRACIANGLVDIVQEAEELFANDQDIKATCAFLMEILAVAF